MTLDVSGFSLTDEDVLLLKNIEDKISSSQKHFTVKSTFFLNERECELVDAVLKKSQFENYTLYGGYGNSKRKIFAVYPPYSYADFSELPIRCVTFDYRPSQQLTHRDILGKLMSLNIERKTVGDILVSDGRACVFVYETVFEQVLYGCDKIGRVGVKASEGFDKSLVREQKFAEIKGTVPSLRADAVVSLISGLSREKAAAFIRKNGIVNNFKDVFKVDAKLAEGDVFSLKGYGKYIFRSVDGLTKKDRIHITIGKFL